LPTNLGPAGGSSRRSVPVAPGERSGLAVRLETAYFDSLGVLPWLEALSRSRTEPPDTDPHVRGGVTGASGRPLPYSDFCGKAVCQESNSILTTRIVLLPVSMLPITLTV
jgi:hypothetical protein